MVIYLSSCRVCCMSISCSRPRGAEPICYCRCTEGSPGRGESGVGASGEGVNTAQLHLAVLGKVHLVAVSVVAPVI